MLVVVVYWLQLEAKISCLTVECTWATMIRFALSIMNKRMRVEGCPSFVKYVEKLIHKLVEDDKSFLVKFLDFLNQIKIQIVNCWSHVPDCTIGCILCKILFLQDFARI